MPKSALRKGVCDAWLRTFTRAYSKWQIVVAVLQLHLVHLTHLFVFLAHFNWKLSVIKYI